MHHPPVMAIQPQISSSPYLNSLTETKATAGHHTPYRTPERDVITSSSLHPQRIIPRFTSHLHGLLLKEPTTVPSLCTNLQPLTFILNRHSSFRSFHVLYILLLGDLGRPYTYFRTNFVLYRPLNPVSFMSDFLNGLIPAWNRGYVMAYRNLRKTKGQER